MSAITERLFERAFADTLLITAEKAAEILGLDDRTFKALADAGAIRSVRIGTRGTTRRYTEDDLRAFLSRETEMPLEQPCQSTSPRKARTGNMTSSIKAVDIAVLRAQRRARRPIGSSKQSA